MKRQPTTLQISWFLDMERNEQLDLNPPYQRKSVWAPKDRRFFLDTIFRNYPTPPIFLHRTIDELGRSTYHVVDGKQRLESILMFAKNEIAIDPNFGDINLNGKKMSELGAEERRKFWDYVLVVDFLDTVDGANIDQVFDRVNRNSKNLQDQELRHARFNGWFISEAESEAEDEFWWRTKINTKAKDKRMKNVQLIAELLLIILDNKIVGFSQDYLDERFAFYDAPEDVEEFDEEIYRDKKANVKGILIEMENHNRCISTYAKTAYSIYTLWSFLALETIEIDATELSDRYAIFMQEVSTISDEVVIEGTTESAIAYYRNSRGAATELPQRSARLEALKTALQNI